jgi:hypothetical protein
MLDIVDADLDNCGELTFEYFFIMVKSLWKHRWKFTVDG